MDAKKPRKGSLTSFPILKATKKQNLTSVKVRTLHFIWEKKGFVVKFWGLRTQWDCCAPRISGDRGRGRGRDRSGWATGKTSWMGRVWFLELEDVKIII